MALQSIQVMRQIDKHDIVSHPRQLLLTNYRCKDLFQV